MWIWLLTLVNKRERVHHKNTYAKKKKMCAYFMRFSVFDHNVVPVLFSNLSSCAVIAGHPAEEQDTSGKQIYHGGHLDEMLVVGLILGLRPGNERRRHWPLWGKDTGGRWIPLTNVEAVYISWRHQESGLMTFSAIIPHLMHFHVALNIAMIPSDLRSSVIQ